jgi:hypothetical protein
MTVNKTLFLTYFHASLVETEQNNVKENCVTLFKKENLSAALWFNPLNAKLNPLCHLLALLRTNHILHVSRIRVNMVTFL